MSEILQVLLAVVAIALTLCLYQLLRRREGGRGKTLLELAQGIGQSVLQLLREARSKRLLAVANFFMTMAAFVCFIVTVVVVFAPSVFQKLGLVEYTAFDKASPVIMFAAVIVLAISSLKLMLQG